MTEAKEASVRVGGYHELGQASVWPGFEEALPHCDVGSGLAGQGHACNRFHSSLRTPWPEAPKGEKQGRGRLLR